VTEPKGPLGAADAEGPSDESTSKTSDEPSVEARPVEPGAADAPVDPVAAVPPPPQPGPEPKHGPPSWVGHALTAIATARAWLVILPLGAAFYAFGWWVDQFYPIKEWLFWHYLLAWAGSVTWALACVSMGHLVVKRVLGMTLPLLEHVSTSFATGVFAFYLAMNVVGHLKLFNGWMFFVLPLVFLLAGARDAYRTIRRLRRHLAHRRRLAQPKPRPFYFWPAIVFGVVSAAMIYFVILTPDNIQFDSRWKHFALAEEMNVTGGIRKFGEGWTVATYPHLASFLFAWPFMCPKVGLFDRVEMAAHLEYVTFIGTLIATPGLVRLMCRPTSPRLGRPRAHLSWVARFLFPGVFLYDSSLSGGGDHIGAFFVIPVVTQLIRGWRDLDWRHMALMAVPLCGVGLTKYTCTMMILPVVGLAVGVRMLMAFYYFVRKRGPELLRQNWIKGPMAALGAIVLLTAAHWVKNWVWYGDPAYPTLYKSLPIHPWIKDAPTLFEYGYKEYQFWRPERSYEGVKETVKALFTFSVIPNDYPRFHGKVPVFGSLLTIFMFALPFLKKGWRIWGVASLIHVAVFIWYWTHHQDRYLQTMLPWMSAVTAALITKLWWDARDDAMFGRIARGGVRVVVAMLIAIQIAWGGDVWFLPNHAMAGSVPKKVIDMIASGYKKDYTTRYKIYGPWTQVAKQLPPKSRVLLHDNHVHLGIGAETINDWGGWQFGISYVRLGSPDAVWKQLHDLGATHVLWDNNVSKGWDSVGGDVVFFEFAARNAGAIKSIGRTRLVSMPKQAPKTEGRNARVLVVGCDKRNYGTGLYDVTDLNVPVFGPKKFKFPKPKKTGKVEELAAEAGALVLDGKCSEAKDVDKDDFQLVARRKRIYAPKGKKEYEIYLRKGGAAAEEPARPKPGKGDEDDGGSDDDFDPSEDAMGERKDPGDDPGE
jgi:hypothetical protein